MESPLEHVASNFGVDLICIENQDQPRYLSDQLEYLRANVAFLRSSPLILQEKIFAGARAQNFKQRLQHFRIHFTF